MIAIEDLIQENKRLFKRIKHVVTQRDVVIDELLKANKNTCPIEAGMPYADELLDRCSHCNQKECWVTYLERLCERSENGHL